MKHSHRPTNARTSAQALALIIVCAALGLLILQHYQSYRSRKAMGRLRYNCEDFGDSEQRLACGAKIIFAYADKYDLERIPGVADRTSSELLAAKTEILAHAAQGPSIDAYKGLERAYGVGPKKAKKLREYLEIGAR